MLENIQVKEVIVVNFFSAFVTQSVKNKFSGLTRILYN